MVGWVQKKLVEHMPYQLYNYSFSFKICAMTSATVPMIVRINVHVLLAMLPPPFRISNH